MALITFDPSKQSTVYFRCNRAGSKKFIFKNSDTLAAYSLSGKVFKAFIKETPQSVNTKIDLTCTVGGAGSNELTVTITSAQAAIKAKDYYFELWETTEKITYINAIAPFTNGVFDGIDDTDENILIQLSGNDVIIYLTVGGGASASGAWVLQGNWDGSTNIFPGPNLKGYAWKNTANTTTLLGPDGGIIPAGMTLVALIDSASTVNDFIYINSY